jgi:hypothetical protein
MLWYTMGAIETLLAETSEKMHNLEEFDLEKQHIKSLSRNSCITARRTLSVNHSVVCWADTMLHAEPIAFTKKD